MKLKRALFLLGWAVAIVLACLIGPASWVYWRTSGDRYDNVTDVPSAEVALVFGAGLQPDGTPTPILADRIHAAVLLYRAGKVQRLLLSGDGRTPGHDEPGAMARQARAEGVPDTAIVLDRGGLRTNDSCMRAHDRFHVHSAVAVSQSYHLPRALFICQHAGIHTTGFSFARVAYGGEPEIRAREVLSLDAAWWQSLFH